MSRAYYNRRVGQDGLPPRLTLPEAAEQLAVAYTFLDQQGYLQRSFGYRCVDVGIVAGLQGFDLRAAILRQAWTKIPNSVEEFLKEADEVALFTVVEFVHDHVAKPADGAGNYHGWSNCGWHYDCRADKFDDASARVEWRAAVNGILKFYEDGYELSTAGEIVHVAPDGLAKLVEAKLSPAVSHTDSAKVAAAVRAFHLGRSSREERKQAVRQLMDLLEFHREAAKRHLSKDEGDLFNIANKFSLRHHNPQQRDDYDDAFLTWLFYVSLSAVHLVLGRVHSHSKVDTVVLDDSLAKPPAQEQADAGAGDDDDIPF